MRNCIVANEYYLAAWTLLPTGEAGVLTEVDATNGGLGREDKKPRPLGDDEDEDGANAGPVFLDGDHCCMCAVSREGRNIVVADLVSVE